MIHAPCSLQNSNSTKNIRKKNYPNLFTERETNVDVLVLIFPALSLRLSICMYFTHTVLPTSGFPNLGAVDILGWIILCCRAS